MTKKIFAILIGFVLVIIIVSTHHSSPATSTESEPASAKTFNDDHTLHLEPNLFTGGAVEDGRTYSVALVAMHTGEIPTNTMIFSQGVLIGNGDFLEPGSFVIGDEKNPKVQLLCVASADEGEEIARLYRQGSTIQVAGHLHHGIGWVKVPVLQDCVSSSPTDKVVRPAETAPVPMAEDQPAPTNTLTQATPEPAQEPVTAPAAEQQPAPTYEPVAAPAPQPNTDALYRVGAGVSAPVALNSVEAEFTDEARRAKYQGVCIVSMIVDPQGNPQNPRVVRGLGMGLNERALEAVRRYRFKPAMLNGRTPVPVMISVEVNFRLY